MSSPTTGRTTAENEESAADLKSDFENLKSSLGQLREDVGKLLSGALGAGQHGAAAIRNQASDAVDGIKQRISGLKDKGADRLESVEQKIADHPLTSALIAFGVGYMLGKLFSRR